MEPRPREPFGSLRAFLDSQPIKPRLLAGGGGERYWVVPSAVLG